MCSTQSALNTAASGFGNQTGAASFFIGPVTRNCGGYNVLITVKFLQNSMGKPPKYFHIVCIRPASGILVHDGMFGYGGGKDPKPLLFREILHFYESIFIGTVAIDTAQHATRTIPFHLRQPLGGKRRHTPSIRRYGDQNQILRLERP